MMVNFEGEKETVAANMGIKLCYMRFKTLPRLT